MTAVLHWHPGILTDGGHTIHLAPLEKLLLVTLCRTRGINCGQGRLTQVMWPDPDHECASSRNSVDVHINRLRRKIGPFGLRIVTHWGRDRELLGGDIHINWRHIAKIRWTELTPLPGRGWRPLTALPSRAYEMAA